MLIHVNDTPPLTCINISLRPGSRLSGLVKKNKKRTCFYEKVVYLHFLFINVIHYIVLEKKLLYLFGMLAFVLTACQKDGGLEGRELRSEAEAFDMPDGIRIIREVTGDKRYSNFSLAHNMVAEDD